MFVLAVIFLTTAAGHMLGGVQCEHSRVIEATGDTAGQIYVENYPISDSSDGSSDGELYRSLIFVPSSIDFGTLAVGTAKSYLVTLVNKNENRSVYLSSISGKTPTFYSSFFEDKVVPPKGNTTFNVVFLPRHFGDVETNLLIHTSFGQAKFPVKGSGKECPYKLTPLIGVKAPLNSTLEPEIHMYNPHSKPIQILEIYSSGGQFQLELPMAGAEKEAPQALWEIPPLTTKSVIRIKFHATQSGNHRCFIRIKISGELENDEEETDEFLSLSSTSKNSVNILNFNDEENNYDPTMQTIKTTTTINSSKKERILVVPVEFEILNEYGIYLPNPIIDFGRLTTNDLPKIFKLNLTNSFSSSDEINLNHYKLLNIVEKNLIKFNKTSSELIINPKMILQKNFYQKINSKLILESLNNNNGENSNTYIEIPIEIRGEIFKGNIDFQRNQTIFITGGNRSKNSSAKFLDTQRTFVIENKFKNSILIKNFTTENDTSEFIKFTNIKLNTILKSNEKLELFQMELLKLDINLKMMLKLETNLTLIEWPLIISQGKLNRWTSIDSVNLTGLPDNSILDFGTVPFGDFSHFGFIVFENKNPFPINLIKWNFTNPKGVYYQSMFLGCKRTKLLHPEKLSIHERFHLCRNLTENSIAAFELAVQSFNIKSFSGSFKVWTDFEHIVIDVKFLTVVGRMEIDQSKLHFTDCFPGKRCSADISIHSTFLKTMRVNAITVSVPGLVFEYHTQNNLPEIKPNSITDVGRIYFDAKSVCTNRCYIPQENDVEAPQQRGLEFDESELRRRTEMFRRFKWNLQTITFTLNTSEIRLFEFNSTVDIIWPKLVNGIQTLQTVEVGQPFHGKITIRNPSDQPILLDLNLSDPKKAKSTSLSLPLEVVEYCVFCYLTDEDVFNLMGNTPQRFLIKSNSQHDIDIKFDAKETGVYSTLLHIRNNLTLYEAIWITGKAVQSKFRFGNRKPGSTTPLLFEITEKLLTSCERALKGEESLSISKKRTFTASNSGEVPILVESFRIGDQICEGYGFKIFPCESFALSANSSKTIDIIFTPDFTMSRVQRPLLLQTNLSYLVNYTLVATVPSSSLEQCSKAIRRPIWEQHIRKMSIGVLTVAFMFVLVAAFFESDKILKDHVENINSKDKGPIHPPLDLRNIAIRNSESEQNGMDKYNGKLSSQQLKKRSTTTNRKISGFSSVAAATIKDNKSWAEELVKKFTSTTIPPSKPKSKDEKLLQTTPPKKNKDNDKKSQDSNEKRNFDNRIEQEVAQNVKRISKLALRKSKSTPLSNDVEFVKSENIKSNNKKLQKEDKKPIDLPQIQSNLIETLQDTPTQKTQINKKYGKTPGRERKKDIELVPKLKQQSVVQRKNSTKFKGNAFQFSSPLGQDYENPQTQNGNVSPLNIGSIWDPNQASFSHVVARNNSVNKIADKYSEYSPEWNDIDMKNEETFGIDITKRNSADLGPIGTRKSPVWEPLPPQQLQSNIQCPRPNLLNNSSFFSNQFSFNGNDYQFDTSNKNEFLDGSAGLLDHLLTNNNSHVQQPSQWQTNDLLLALSASNSNNWQMGTWTPMGYKQDHHPNNSDAWHGSTVRPPPGLPNRMASPIQHQQVQEQSQIQQQQQQQQQQQLQQQKQQQLILLQLQLQAQAAAVSSSNANLKSLNGTSQSNPSGSNDWNIWTPMGYQQSPSNNNTSNTNQQQNSTESNQANELQFGSIWSNSWNNKNNNNQ